MNVFSIVDKSSPAMEIPKDNPEVILKWSKFEEIASMYNSIDKLILLNLIILLRFIASTLESGLVEIDG